MKKIFAILLVVAALNLVLAGCNKGEEAPAGGGTDTKTTGESK